MNKKLLIVGLLAVLFLPGIVSSASTGTYAWLWTQCTGGQTKGNFEIQANVNSAYVVISWTVPTKSYEFLFGCSPQRLASVQISATVSTISYTAIPSQAVSSASSGSISLILQVITCNRLGCSSPHPYPVPYGSVVTVSIYAVYGGGIVSYDHGTTDSLKVTS